MRVFRFGFLLILLIVWVGYAQNAQIGTDGTLIFLPRTGNSLVCGVLLIWLLMIRSLSEFKRQIGE
jgi:hypothetical protein